VKWGVRKRMEKGQRRMPTRTTLGYDEVDGKIVVNKAEAEIVIDIFDKYLAGYTIRELVKFLNDKHIKKKGSNEEWKLANISRMLSNEKYVGEFIMQKTVVLDFLTHKAYKNDGLVEQYIVPNHHEAIISKPVFEAVQALKEKNNVFKGGMLFEPVNKLTSILFCSDCLRPMKYQDVKPANGPVRKFITCRGVNKSNAGYATCNIHETLDFDAAHKAASEVVLKFMEMDERIFENIKEAYDYAINKAHDDLVILKNEASDINSKMSLLVKLATETDDINKYKDEYEALEKKLEGINQNIEDIKSDLAKVTWDYMNTKFLSDFYEKKAITYAVVRKVIKIAFRLPDKSIRFVIGDSELEPTKETFDAVMKLNPIYYSSVKGNRKKDLKYDVVRYEGN
jgi:site-specific DNA recombinase